ncbi:MAG: 2-deoxy-D-gluconate 3-dehydrogenase [Phenylobacterium sp.]|uniref:SDR family NAD(P)-dependent oxidoreductase n=1 Tax=Phenylobacterium sp. TaxID=1871053 RepID=UPI002635EE4C|nr:SDR family oxidoreductase [Phenylobacterium sp.]MDB5498745.1 2-deoxy-D-gluconate 3-dehydrogenase [Phenylobacterium sp.]
MAYKPFDLTGKVALVTGGNGGIGLGMADAMAQAGAAIVIWGTNAEKNAAAEDQLKAHGVKVVTQKIDVADEAQVTAGMAEAVGKMGRVDTVIANAGVGGGAKSFAEFSTETYRRVLSVNLDGVFFTFREACKHMVERAGAGDPGGSLVVTSSLSAIDGAARNEAYASTKGAVISMIRAIAVEHARYGVRANAILPGWIATDMTAGAQGNDKFNDAVIKRVPFRRWGEPEDFGGMAVYLASDASSFHTGDSFLIDGGYAIF